MIALQIYSPSPSPVVKGAAPELARKNCWNRWGWALAATPMPWLRTLSCAWRPCGAAAITISPPAGLYFTAFWSKILEHLLQPDWVADDRRAAPGR